MKALLVMIPPIASLGYDPFGVGVAVAVYGLSVGILLGGLVCLWTRRTRTQ